LTHFKNFVKDFHQNKKNNQIQARACIKYIHSQKRKFKTTIQLFIKDTCLIY